MSDKMDAGWQYLSIVPHSDGDCCENIPYNDVDELVNGDIEAGKPSGESPNPGVL